MEFYSRVETTILKALENRDVRVVGMGRYNYFLSIIFDVNNTNNEFWRISWDVDKKTGVVVYGILVINDKTTVIPHLTAKRISDACAEFLVMHKLSS